jgi:hypothetical protein
MYLVTPRQTRYNQSIRPITRQYTIYNDVLNAHNLQAMLLERIKYTRQRINYFYGEHKKENI